MLDLPKNTEFNRRIPKTKFYVNLSVTPALRRVFVEQIKAIRWCNKIAATTLNLAAGKNVTEIEIIEIALSRPNLDENVLRLIDREIPYHIVFLLEFEGKYQIWTAYKENAASGSGAFKVESYYHTGWTREDELSLHIEGLDLDVVYENFVRQVAGDQLQNKPDESLKESVEREQRKTELRKQISKLETLIRREKQLNKQVPLNTELKRLKKFVEELK